MLELNQLYNIEWVYCPICGKKICRADSEQEALLYFWCKECKKEVPVKISRKKYPSNFECAKEQCAYKFEDSLLTCICSRTGRITQTKLEPDATKPCTHCDGCEKYK